MAVYERAWHAYQGPYTSLRWRFLVISRYALRDAFASRVFTGFYVLCALPSVLCLAAIYLSHNLGLLENVGLTPEYMANLVLSFLHWLFLCQAIPAFLLAVIVSPSLVAADLSNAALPLYLCRPISRAQYVLGKMAVVGLLLSPVTWGAGLLNYGLQAYMTGEGWWHQHLRIAVAYVIGHGAWIVVVSLLSLAVSAWVRHKWVARGVLSGMLFISWAFASLINGVVGTEWGTVLNLVGVVWLVVRHLFDPTVPTPIPVWAAWAALAALALFSLGLLRRKLQAYEEIR
jgi:ABC-type transport system involved in multi-copper enzyme maturation permease subunit